MEPRSVIVNHLHLIYTSLRETTCDPIPAAEVSHYLVLQSGNWGGFFIALKRESDTYRVVPIGPADQGKLGLWASTPSRIVVWSADPEDPGMCTACPKRYVVETMELSGKAFKVVGRTRTNQTYTSFQDDPLVVSWDK